MARPALSRPIPKHVKGGSALRAALDFEATAGAIMCQKGDCAEYHTARAEAEYFWQLYREGTAACVEFVVRDGRAVEAVPALVN